MEKREVGFEPSRRARLRGHGPRGARRPDPARSDIPHQRRFTASQL